MTKSTKSRGLTYNTTDNKILILPNFILTTEIAAAKELSSQVHWMVTEGDELQHFIQPLEEEIIF